MNAIGRNVQAYSLKSPNFGLVDLVDTNLAIWLDLFETFH